MKEQNPGRGKIRESLWRVVDVANREFEITFYGRREVLKSEPNYITGRLEEEPTEVRYGPSRIDNLKKAAHSLFPRRMSRV